MAMSASSSCAQSVTRMISSTDRSTAGTSTSSPQGLAPLPAQPKFEGSGLRRTKSRKPVKATAARETTTELHSAIAKVGEEIATTSEDILDTVAGTKRGKMNSRTSRRRALVMCLALGMVRPCASNVASNLKESNDLRRTVSEFPVSSRAQASVLTLMSQVSLATSLKQTNLFGQQEDLQKLTTLQ